MAERIQKRAVKVGNITLGGGAPVAVQSMLNVPAMISKATCGRPCGCKGRLPDNSGRSANPCRCTPDCSFKKTSGNSGGGRHPF